MDNNASLYIAAKEMLAAGVSAIPLHGKWNREKSKLPNIAGWEQYCIGHPTEANLALWFDEGCCGFVPGILARTGGIGVCCGQSGGFAPETALVCLDYDKKAFGKSSDCEKLYEDAWDSLLESNDWLKTLIQNAPCELTPSGGKHWYFLVDYSGGLPRNTKLIARLQIDNNGETVKDKGGRDVYACVLETRGHGGQSACWPTEGYERVGDKWWLDLQVTSNEDWQRMLTAFSAISEETIPAITFKNAPSDRPQRTLREGEVTPGDDYNSKTNLREYLENLGWSYAFANSRGEAWLRPDDGVPSIAASSATLMEGEDDTPDRLYVFSSNTPLPADKAHSAFSIKAHYEFGGDFSACAKQLRKDGFGKQPAKWNYKDFVPLQDSRYKVMTNGTILKQVGENCLKVCSHPIYVDYLSEASDDGSQKIVLKWPRQGDGALRSRPVDRKIISSRSEIINLANYGVDVTSETAGRLVEYLSDLFAHYADQIPIASRINKLGWSRVDDKPVFCAGPDAIFGLAEDSLTEFTAEASMKAFRSFGDLEDWVEMMKRINDYPVVQFCVMASFAAPFLKNIFDLAQPPTIELCSSTSQGKTTALQAVAGVWGRNTEGGTDTIISSWNSTPHALTVQMAERRDMPTILDEATTASSSINLAELIYSYSGGKSKAQGKADGGLRERYEFSGVLFSSSERSLVDQTKTSGIGARVFSLTTSPLGECGYEFASKLKNDLTQVYGVAGQEFMRYVLTDFPTFKANAIRHYKTAREKFISHDLSAAHSRLLEPLCAIGAIGGMMGQYFNLGWSAKSIVEEILKITTTQHESNAHDRAFEKLSQWVTVHLRDFENAEGHDKSGVTRGVVRFRENKNQNARDDLEDGGKFHDLVNRVDIIKSEAAAVLESAGFDLGAMLPYWVKEGRVKTDPGRSTKKVWVNGRSTTCVSLIDPFEN